MALFTTSTLALKAAAVTAGTTQTSLWFPCGDLVNRFVEIDIDTAGSASALIVVQQSTLHYTKLRTLTTAATISTDDYEATTLNATQTAATRTRYDKNTATVGVNLDTPQKAWRVLVTGNGGTDAFTVSAYLGGQGAI